VYSLWDEYSSMGCVCDGGYAGADCSEKICKFGADPLYYDDMANIRYSNFTIQIYTVGVKTVKVYGNYSIIFTDHFGEDWETGPIDNQANCKSVISALEALPNDVIPPGTIRCFNAGEKYGIGVNGVVYSEFEDSENDHTFSGVTQSYADAGGSNADMIIHNRYIISFPGNAGKLPPIRINKYLDGTRPTMYTDELTSTLGWHIYSNGFIGEDDDLVADLCEGIQVSLDSTPAVGSGYHQLIVAAGQDSKAVKRCLGDSDGYDGNNVDVYNWDYGTDENPHLIKLIDATQYQYSGGLNANSQASATTPLGLGNPNVFQQFNLGVPYTQLCHSNSRNETDLNYDSDLSYGRGWCENLNPPGFYAVLKYDEVNDIFKIYTRAGDDFDSTTKFWLYTTKGTLQVVNTETTAFNVATSMSTDEKVAGIHSNLVYVTNTSHALAFDDVSFDGQIDCETIDPLADPSQRGIRIKNPSMYSKVAAGGDGVDEYSTRIGVRTCLDKDDYVMIFNTDMSDEGLATNPVYPDIYTVKKIYRDENHNLVDNADEIVTSENNKWRRHKLVLDYGLNAQFVLDEGGGALLSGNIFRFTPDPDAGPYNYVGECSNRGICDSTTGLCQCFAGYTSDNCGVQNSLAH